MRSDDWQPMETAPLNPYGKAFGPVVLIWCASDDHPWPAYFEPWHKWEHRDCGPAWVIPDQAKTQEIDMARCTNAIPQCWHRVMGWGCTCHLPTPKHCPTCGKLMKGSK